MRHERIMRRSTAGAQDTSYQAPDRAGRPPAHEPALPHREGGSAASAVVRSPGEPLDRETRGDMESRFGHDFSQVRVHADAEADESARSVGARAYAAGDHLVFKATEYRPDTADGLHTLGHELAHVVQQRQGRAPAAGEPGLSLAVDGALEAEADRAATAVANDRSAANEVGSAAGGRAGSSDGGVVAQPLLDDMFSLAGPLLGMAANPIGGLADVVKGSGILPDDMSIGLPNPFKGESPPLFNPTPKLPFDLPSLPDISKLNPFGGGGPGPFFNPTPELPFDLPDLSALNPFGGGGPGPFFNPTPKIPGLPSMESIGTGGMGGLLRNLWD